MSILPWRSSHPPLSASPSTADVLKDARKAIVRSVSRIAIHDQPYVQVLYSPLDDLDKILQARVGTESTYPGLSEGDHVTVYSMMNVVTRIAASGDCDD